MKTLLLSTKGNVYKVVADTKGGYICELGTWCSVKGDYLFDEGIVESYTVYDKDVEIIDTNTAVILNAKSRMMGFELDYIEV